MILPLKLDTTQADKDLKDFQQAAQRTAKAAEGIKLSMIMEKAVGHIGDVKDILEKTGKSLLGFSQATVDTIVKTGDLAEKGASLGSSFGPMGAVVGALAGGLIGYASAAYDSEVATARLAAEFSNLKLNVDNVVKAIGEAERVREIADSASRAAYSLSSAIDDALHPEDLPKSSKALKEAIEAHEVSLEQAGKNAESHAKKLKGLQKTVEEVSVRYTDNLGDQEKKEKDLEKAKQAVLAKEEELAGLTANTLPVLEKYNALLAAQATRTTAVTKEISTQTKTITVNIDKIKAHQKAIMDDRAEAARTQRVNEILEDNADRERHAADRLKIEQDLNASLLSETQRAVDERQSLADQNTSAAIDKYSNYASLITSVTGSLTSQLEANVAAGEALFTGFGAAAEKGVSQVLKALGKEYSVKAIGEVAVGLAAIAASDYKAAGAAFLSAAQFGLAATAAGVAGAVVGGDASRRDSARSESAGGVSGGSAGSATDSGRISDPGPQSMTPVVINFNSSVPPTERGAQQQAAEVQKILDSRGRF